MLIRYLVCFFLPIGLALLLYAALGPWLFEQSQASADVMRSVVNEGAIDLDAVRQISHRADQVGWITGLSIVALYALVTLLFAPRGDLRKGADILTALSFGVAAAYLLIGFHATTWVNLAVYIGVGVAVGAALILLRKTRA